MSADIADGHSVDGHIPMDDDPAPVPDPLAGLVA
jgi:hypothetical protein